MIEAGQRFGRLVTTNDVGRSADGHRMWQCLCDCGNVCQRQTNNLRSTGVKSCGCVALEGRRTHGKRYTVEYSAWRAAKGRCHSPVHKDYHRYGARGIQMCPEWRESFEKFLAHMGNRPAGTSSIERRNVNGNYEPGNCVWATPVIQARNRRNSVYVEWKGELNHLCIVASQLGITYGAAFMRHQRGKLHDCA